MLTEKFISVSLISPEKVLFEGGATSVTLPGSDGQFTILPGHVNIVSVLNPGFVTIKNDEKEDTFIINGGFVEASKNQVNTLIEGIIDISKIDPEEDKKEIDALLGQIISPEKRGQIENKLANHRFKVTLAQKKSG